jgi:hypothetical protein
MQQNGDRPACSKMVIVKWVLVKWNATFEKFCVQACIQLRESFLKMDSVACQLPENGLFSCLKQLH